ncbi:ATP-binding protein [Argonema antarcticum]|uniref:ATP-binding protein n=1 Tax=Argonema antarcticum TaxID=2942763 RepID=UPI0020130909|nr:ATP-binding protein [Argonema antarcticum]MCL1475070.1 GAF domain-containing protein [Argonema antarcticum A004/B2]
MKNSTITPRIILELTGSNWYSCLQVLKIALESGGWIGALLVVGENLELCQKLAQAGSEIVEMAQIAIDSPNSDHLQGSSANAVRMTAQKLCEPVPAIQLITLPGMEASVIVLSTGFNLWMQVEPVKTPDSINATWRILLVFDSQSIAELLAHPAIAIAAPQCSQLTAADLKNNNSALKRLWLQLLPLVLPASLVIEEQEKFYTFFAEVDCANGCREAEKHEGCSENTFKFTLASQIPSVCEFSISPLNSSSPALMLDPLFWESPTGILFECLDGGILRANPAFEKLTGYTEAQLRRLDCRSITHPEDFATEVRCIQQLIHGSLQRQTLQKRFICRDGEIIWTEVTMSAIVTPEPEDSYLLVFVKDLSSIQRAEQELQKRRQWESLLSEIAATIRSTFDFPKILEIAVKRLRFALSTDRVVAYRLQPDQSGICTAEAVDPAYPTIWGQTFSAETIPASYLKAYCEGRLWHVADIRAEGLSSCHVQMLEAIKVRSMMAVPIQRVDEDLKPLQLRPLWGLILVHHCRTPRLWTADEQQLVQAVANQVAIAFEQSVRVQQLQVHAEELEERVKQRTRSLERSLQFEQLIRNLTKTLYRGDLEEDQMLQAAVEGLVQTLGVAGCYASLFDRQQLLLSVRCEYFNNKIESFWPILSRQERTGNAGREVGESGNGQESNLPADLSLVGMHLPLLNLPENCRSAILGGKSCYINNSEKKLPLANRHTVLISPIWDAQGLIGTICVVPGAGLGSVSTPRQLEADEMQLVEQVSSQCAIAILQSRTWRRLQAQNHELATLNRVKGELIANTSHELRTPLTAILGFSGVLLQECFGPLNVKQKEYVDRINSSGQHLLEVINDILDLSRIEAGRLELELQVVFIDEVVHTAIDFIRERVQEQGLTLEIEVEPSLEYFVADSRRLKQMLLNLLSNAIKFTPVGTVGLKVYKSRLLLEGRPIDRINFLVWDTGIGIDPAEQGQLFSPFSQIDSSLSRQYQGTGLGLAIVRKLAELHGGCITLDSGKGQGARFTLSLPLLSSSEAI